MKGTLKIFQALAWLWEEHKCSPHPHHLLLCPTRGCIRLCPHSHTGILLRNQLERKTPKDEHNAAGLLCPALPSPALPTPAFPVLEAGGEEITLWESFFFFSPVGGGSNQVTMLLTEGLPGLHKVSDVPAPAGRIEGIRIHWEAG